MRTTPTLLLLLLPGLAEAKPKVALIGSFDEDLDLAQQAALASAFAAVLGEDARLDVYGPDRLAGAIRGREGLIVEEAFLGRGRDLQESGRLLFQQAQPAEAAAAVEEAIVELDVGVTLTGQPRRLWDAWVLLGTSRWAQGDEQGARDAFAQAIALAPDRRPNAALYAPDVLALYDAERELSGDEGASLRLTCAGEGATITLDGVDRGPSPILIDPMLPGTHYALCTLPTGLRVSRRIELNEGSPLGIDLYPDAPKLVAPAGSPAGRSRQIGALARAIGEAGSLDWVVVAGNTDSLDGAWVVQAWQVGTESWTAPVPATSELPSLIAAVRQVSVGIATDVDGQDALPAAFDVSSNPLIARMLMSPAPAPAAQPNGRPGRQDPPAANPQPTRPDAPPPAQPNPSGKNKALLWGAVGGGAAAVLLGVILGVTLGGAPSNVEPERIEDGRIGVALP
jgi:hypothetical protein